MVMVFLREESHEIQMPPRPLHGQKDNTVNCPPFEKNVVLL